MRNFLFDVKLQDGSHFEELVTAPTRNIAIDILEDTFPVARIHLLTIL